MDRIRKALDKFASQAPPPAPAAAAVVMTPPPPVADAAPPPHDGEIVYSRTSVHPIAPEAARRNRLVAVADDARAAPFQVLRTRILHLCRSNGWKTLGVTSAHSGAGKTFVSVNLAVSIALEANQTVLLADFDLHHPHIARVLGHPVGEGLRDCLLNGRPVEDMLFNPGIPQLVVLPGAGSVRKASNLLASKRTRALIDELKARYESRLLLLDLPPMAAGDDVLVCLPYLDAVILVVEYGRTTEDKLEFGLEVLKSTPIAAVVLNKVRHPGKPDEYYDYDYR